MTTPDEQIALSERAQRLHTITEYPEWAELRQAMDDRRERETKRLTKSMMRGYPVSVETQLRHAGFWEGVKAVLETPGAVEARLKKMLDTAESAQQEGVTDATRSS